jgi:SPP1 family predicted phage head-tail adaptor
MLAGSFDTPITIERKTITKDTTYGAAVESWVSITGTRRIWAEVRDVQPSRSEAVQQGLQVATNQTRIRMRYRSDIDSSMRITVHRATDQLYQIVGGPAELGRRVGLEIVAEKYSTQGG